MAELPVKKDIAERAQPISNRKEDAKANQLIGSRQCLFVHIFSITGSQSQQKPMSSPAKSSFICNLTARSGSSLLDLEGYLLQKLVYTLCVSEPGRDCILRQPHILFKQSDAPVPDLLSQLSPLVLRCIREHLLVYIQSDCTTVLQC